MHSIKHNVLLMFVQYTTSNHILNTYLLICLYVYIYIYNEVFI